MGYEASFHSKSRHSKYSPGTAVVSGISEAGRKGLTSRISTGTSQGSESGAIPRSRSKTREWGTVGAKREPLRVRLLSGSILNRAIEWSLDLPPSAFPLLSTLNRHHESSPPTQDTVLGARNEKERASSSPLLRNKGATDTRELTNVGSVATQRPSLPLGTLMKLNSHRLGGCELRAMESIYEVERL